MYQQGANHMTRAEFINTHRNNHTVLAYSFGRPSFKITANSKHTIEGNMIVHNGKRTALDGYTVAVLL
jgi:hypothetical protein